MYIHHPKLGLNLVDVLENGLVVATWTWVQISKITQLVIGS